MSNTIEVAIEPSFTPNSNISNVLMSETIEVAIEPSMTSENPIPIPNINIESPIVTKQSCGPRGPYNKQKKSTSIDINGFDIYRMQRTNIIRVHDVSILCRHSIRSRDVILKVDNVPIENWTYRSLNNYLCNNVITSIETQCYEEYNFNLHNPVHSSLMTPTTSSNTYDTASTDNICNNSGAVLFPLNVN